jgi:hypothetical protein
MKIKQAADCRWDLVSLGEVMLRLDPGAGRVHTTRHFDVWEGGGEIEGRGLEWALRCGVAHGALAMLTPGDTSMASRSEVERLMAGQTARIVR